MSSLRGLIDPAVKDKEKNLGGMRHRGPDLMGFMERLFLLGKDLEPALNIISLKMRCYF